MQKMEGEGKSCVTPCAGCQMTANWRETKKDESVCWFKRLGLRIYVGYRCKKIGHPPSETKHIKARFGLKCLIH